MKLRAAVVAVLQRQRAGAAVAGDEPVGGSRVSTARLGFLSKQLTELPRSDGEDSSASEVKYDCPKLWLMK